MRATGWRRLILAAGFWAVAAHGGGAAPTRIIAWDQTFQYPDSPTFLRLALERTEAEYGPARLVRSEPMTQERAIQELARGADTIDVAGLAATREREAMLRPIRIPYLQGLLGLRICLIRPGDEERFRSVGTASQWQDAGLTIGVGTDWPDKAILEHNGFRLFHTSNADALPELLRAGRFDCLLYSAADIRIHKQRANFEDLAVEPALMLVYPQPEFFFVGPDDQRLQQRLKLGLERAMEDGSYREVFLQVHGDVINRLGLRERRQIRLQNPGLTEETRQVLQERKGFLLPRISRDDGA